MHGSFLGRILERSLEAMGIGNLGGEVGKCDDF